MFLHNFKLLLTLLGTKKLIIIISYSNFLFINNYHQVIF